MKECPKCESLNVGVQSVDESYEQVIDVCDDCGWESEPRSENETVEKMLEQDRENGKDFANELIVIIKKYKLNEIVGMTAGEVAKTMVNAVMKEGIK